MVRSRLVLSPARIKAAVPQTHDCWLSDNDGTRGTGRLQLRVSPTGVKRFYYRTARTPGRPSKVIPLGLYSHISRPGHLTLTEARARSRKIAAELELQGELSRREVRAAATIAHSAGGAAASSPYAAGSTAHAQSPAIAKSSGTLIELCRAYSSDLAARRKFSAGDVRAYFERELTGSDLARRPAADITSDEFAVFLGTVLNRKSGYVAGKLRTLLSSAYAFGQRVKVQRGETPTFWHLPSNPLEQVERLSEHTKPRKRYLSKKELAHFLTRLVLSGEDVESMQLRALRIAILLAGQRFEQLLRVTVTDLDWERMWIYMLDEKGRRPRGPRVHVLPILPEVERELRWLEQRCRARGSEFLFASDVEGKVLNASSVSSFVRRTVDQMLNSAEISKRFQMLDIRRTAETWLGDLGVSKDMRAQLLSHGISGVQAVHYDQNKYMDQKRAALCTWLEFLADLTQGAFIQKPRTTCNDCKDHADPAASE